MPRVTLSLDNVGLSHLLQAHRNYFHTGETRPLEFRLAQLEALREAIKHYEEDIMAALKADLGKSGFEAYATEIGFTLDEISHALKYLPEWMETETVKTPLVHQPGQSYLIYEPRGVSLIIAPWNYPVQLLLDPLVGALAAGNTAILKPSELAPRTSEVMARLIEHTFQPDYVTVIEGGIEVNQALLEQQFDHIFFTGSTRVGKIVMEKAAQHLTPVTLELGGKSPCIVDRGVPLDLTAKRIIWGKFLNAGQTCVAPDYVLVHEDDKLDLLEAMRKYIRRFYGKAPIKSKDFGRIINEQHFDRLLELLQASRIAAGGQHERSQKFIAPTLLSPVAWNDPIMQEEIFGPLLPVLTYKSLDEVVQKVLERPRPLALYIFSANEEHQQDLITRLPFGGGCINDTLIHLASPHLPFGGSGSSGLGAYHGRYSFETFSHRKALMQRPLKLDLPLRYPPYPNWKSKIVRKIMK